MRRRLRPWDDLSTQPSNLLPSLWSSSRVVVLIKVHLACSLLTLVMALMPATGSSQESANGTKDFSEIVFHNASATFSGPEIFRINSTSSEISENDASVHNNPSVSVEEDIPREYPTALVIASSVAAVSILVFFFLAYCWHTHQLDSRARKLAIRLAADAEQGARRRSCVAPQSRSHIRAPSVSEPSPDRNHYEALALEDDLGQYSDCGRSSRGVSESEAGDSEDMFGHPHLPGIGERGRSFTKGVRGGHKKWNRSRKHSSGASLDKRDSAVTDKEILTHFASRRHSTFFI
ncbi:hypothetical protein Bpfe_009904 [Biomphalaria pfeifferi]|uniref:Uncharacterized protein n=1 Tax=Biomphalaria pfeifferi TaxID=112525 RepID=A0AAD8BTS8_BIOPF|nr:hypothetical protein Bpfe_009904 [Biomphalaria pfeifferi]